MHTHALKSTHTQAHAHASTRKHTHTQQANILICKQKKAQKRSQIQITALYYILSLNTVSVIFPSSLALFLGLFLQPDTFAAVSSGQRDQENSLCQICASKHTCLVTYSETLFLRDKIRVQLMNPYLVVFC